MKKKILIIIAAVVLAAGIAVVATMGGIGYFTYLAHGETVTAPEPDKDGYITVMSANIRRQEKFFSTKKADVGNHRWYRRAEYYLQNIALVQPDIFGAQEAQERQYKYLVKHMEGYGSVVTYRDDRGTRSESCPIFYSEKRFKLLDSGTFWLSATPDVKYSKFEESTECRIATYVILEDKQNGDTYAVFNAHPDWDVKRGRDKELQVLATRIASISAEKAVDHIILFGDLNTDKHTEDGAKALQVIDDILKDAKTFEGMKDYGVTFHNYGIDDPEDPQASLDYIYLSDGAEVRDLGKIDKTYGKDGKIYPSDHYPIYAKVKFN